jgi:hypothetical protein
MSIVHNERIKLLAGTLNTMGIAMAVTGAIAPVVGAIYGTMPPMPLWGRIFAGMVWFSAGAIIHLVAQLTLGRLPDV